KVRFLGFTGHKSPHILLKMLQHDFDWDTCQLPINVMDAHFRSFQREVLPELNRRGIAALGMKSLGGEAQLVTEAGLSPAECRRYALSQPISTLICGMQTLENLRQDLEIARSFTPLSEAEERELLDRVRPVAGDGRYEWFKTTQYFDSNLHRDQHGYPPIRHVGDRAKESA
ncbi:MAG: aldo/keto reductase, partial [Planctomycetes bacterium]|nr:aldo/keto reductase [Planctomycetota bacterium]